MLFVCKLCRGRKGGGERPSMLSVGRREIHAYTLVLKEKRTESCFFMTMMIPSVLRKKREESNEGLPKE